MADQKVSNGTEADSVEVGLTEEEFTELYKNQFLSSGVPEHLWKSVYQKVTEETYDIGQYVMEMQEEVEGKPVQSRMIVHNDKGIKAMDSTSVFLVDHAWTFELKYARAHLTQFPALLQRVGLMMNLDMDNLDTEQSGDLVMRHLWKIVQTYKIRTPDMPANEVMPLWYVTDEVGSKIQHSDKPSCKMVPFTTSQCVYSLLWPLRDIGINEEMTVNRVYSRSAEDLVLQALSQPWAPSDMTHVPFTLTQPSAEYFQKFREAETLPDPNLSYKPLPKDAKLRVFVSYQNFREFLTDDRFILVDAPEEADIVWIAQSFKDYEELSVNHPGRHINQFPCEMILTVKDLLAIVSRRAAKKPPPTPLALEPKWLPVTFNLETELPQFVSYFQAREKEGLDNTWICKPWNLARGMDITISDDLNCIVRLPETGPKVACKYVENLVLFDRGDIGKVKFDVRYIVLLRSVQPLKLYAYKVFWLRFANIEFSMDHFEEYEKHFTVMNYVPSELKQIHYDEFIPMFEQQNPGFSWSTVEGSIFEMLRELFEAAVSMPPPQGLAHSPQSRSMYAVDLLLKWDKNDAGERCIMPQLCEVNFCPDCERACKYHPFFVNDVFSTLFLDDTEGKHVQLIS
ncbi:tubulin--tyrosine ligase-like protein 12 [Babylonia areolata]|uniref:tubulin--tyrosine ligase-like protein 12 n=1 Tax=Babylonia areolata TaxID=304850 RepID=UPI003FD112CA